MSDFINFNWWYVAAPALAIAVWTISFFSVFIRNDQVYIRYSVPLLSTLAAIAVMLLVFIESFSGIVKMVGYHPEDPTDDTGTIAALIICLAALGYGYVLKFVGERILYAHYDHLKCIVECARQRAETRMSREYGSEIELLREQAGICDYETYSSIDEANRNSQMDLWDDGDDIFDIDAILEEVRAFRQGDY